MESKEKTLKNALLSCDMEYLESEIIECLQEDTAEGKILRACTEAMDIHARNVLVEFHIKYFGYINTTRASHEMVVDTFLLSEYDKELTK